MALVPWQQPFPNNVNFPVQLRFVKHLSKLWGTAAALNRYSNVTLWQRGATDKRGFPLPVRRYPLRSNYRRRTPVTVPYRRGPARMAYGRRSSRYGRRAFTARRRYKGTRFSSSAPIPRSIAFRGQTSNNFTRAKFTVNALIAYLNGTAVGSPISAIGQSTTDSIYYFYHQIADIPSIAQYGALWDQCMLTGVTVSLVPRQTMQPVGNTSNGSSLYAYSAVDEEGQFSVTTMSKLEQRMGAKRWSAFRPIQFYYRPKVLVNRVAAGNTAPTPMVMKPGWDGSVSINNITPLYGFYIGIPGGDSSTNEIQYDINCVYTVAFRNRIA